MTTARNADAARPVRSSPVVRVAPQKRGNPAGPLRQAEALAEVRAPVHVPQDGEETQHRRQQDDSKEGEGGGPFHGAGTRGGLLYRCPLDATPDPREGSSTPPVYGARPWSSCRPRRGAPAPRSAPTVWN